MALTVPRLTPIRKAILRCERRPSRNIRRISSTTVVAIIVQFSPEIAVLRLGSTAPRPTQRRPTDPRWGSDECSVMAMAPVLDCGLEVSWSGAG